MAEIDVRIGQVGTITSIRYSNGEAVRVNPITTRIQVFDPLNSTKQSDICDATITAIDDLIRALQLGKKLLI